MEELNNIILKSLKYNPCLKRAYGVVTEEILDKNNNPTKKFKVRITRDQEEIKDIQYAISRGITINTSKDLTFVNKTIETGDDVLKPGDIVWVHYWNTISDGYIAIKVGLSHLGTSEDVRPFHRVSIITDAYIIKPYGTE